MTENEKKRIEDYINDYRVYPEEYKGKRDKSILVTLGSNYKLYPETMIVSRLEGRINDTGDFEIVGRFTFPLGKPEERVPDNSIDLKPIIKSYNELVADLGYKDSIIGPGKNENWNLRDMVSEIEYIRSLYYTKGHDRNKLKTEDPRAFNNQTARLRYFIRTYKEGIVDLVVTQEHNSKYDNLTKEVL